MHKNEFRSTTFQKARKIIFWITTTIIAIAYFITGIGKFITLCPHRAGYGTFGLSGLLPQNNWHLENTCGNCGGHSQHFNRIKEWVYAGMILDLTGAALSRYFMGDPLPMIIIPLGLSVLVTVNYVLRHALQNKITGANGHYL